MEKAVYELRPYFYLMLSTWTFLNLGDSSLAKFSATVLCLNAFLVIYMRYQYRRHYK